jgi:hypothetical protein
MQAKHQRTLEAIYERPVRANIRWADIEALFRALEAEVSEGRGSRVRVSLNGRDLVAHRPHPRPDTNKGAVAAVRAFLESIGVRP